MKRHGSFLIKIFFFFIMVASAITSENTKKEATK